jgi:hypothetical protein
MKRIALVPMLLLTALLMHLGFLATAADVGRPRIETMSASGRMTWMLRAVQAGDGEILHRHAWFPGILACQRTERRHVPGNTTI